jgi:predicted Na+-dependent transporter
VAESFANLARGNVALSVTLTAVSCPAAVLTTPLALAVLPAQVTVLLVAALVFRRAWTGDEP